LLGHAVRRGDADSVEFAHAALRILAAAGAMHGSRPGEWMDDEGGRRKVGKEEDDRPNLEAVHLAVPTSQNLARLGTAICQVHFMDNTFDRSLGTHATATASPWLARPNLRLSRPTLLKPYPLSISSSLFSDRCGGGLPEDVEQAAVCGGAF
jgi:hypothetical protein